MSTRSLAERVREDLEPELRKGQDLGPSTDIPFAVFVYAPGDELEMRKQISLLSTRLRQEDRCEVAEVDLGEVMWRCLDEEAGNLDELVAIEQSASSLDLFLQEAKVLLSGVDSSQPGPLEERVIDRLEDLDRDTGIGLLYRAGELFPMYRTSALLERMIGRIRTRAVLFYPGELRGARELSFMGRCEPSPNYRPRIFS